MLVQINGRNDNFTQNIKIIRMHVKVRKPVKH